jgi:restriction system protein
MPFIDYDIKAKNGEIVVYGKDLDELIHNIELKMGENLIDWNEKYLINVNRITNKILFSNEVDKNSYLIELHKSEPNEEELWYNRHTEIYSEGKLQKLKKILNHLEQLNFNLLDPPLIPSAADLPYPKIGFIDKILGYKEIIRKYEDNVEKTKTKALQLSKVKREYDKLNELFELKINDFKYKIKEQLQIIKEDINSGFKERIQQYEVGNSNVYFAESVLRYSILNSLYDFQYNIEELKDGKLLICEISLPNDKDISNIKGFKEYKRDNRVEPIYYNEKDFKKTYNSILYSIVFRVIKEVYYSDYNCQIKSLTMNGWVNALNKKNGKYENRCIVSLSINSEQFEDIDFSNVDLKEAFKHLKGISAASLIDFIPIAPIISINKSDKRFIQSEEVLKNISESTNIAAVDWEEFEHLVRELFEKEFAVNGGEVKVTQSSRDGGVDAIAFDPDPIRGGKIVIQSKRYTNVVGVSAIRDLYGTVLNEGATKGIIVTTSHYGSDAYEFAKGKPLTLLDGNNLLALLQKHGYNARINIEEAKKLNKE